MVRLKPHSRDPDLIFHFKVVLETKVNKPQFLERFQLERYLEVYFSIIFGLTSFRKLKKLSKKMTLNNIYYNLQKIRISFFDYVFSKMKRSINILYK
jgi:hypothetical protein